MVARIKTVPVKVGKITIGGENPIVVQSMTNTNTANTEDTVEQIIRVVDNGGELVRTTVRNISEAENLKNIKASLDNRNIETPLSADVHFNPEIAFVAAKHYDKVRINPGNFGTNNTKSEYTSDEYEIEYKTAENLFIELLNICEKHQTAIRIGVNHGSLSKRVVSRFGDTPKGMVESAMEFIRIAKKRDFENIVISLKSSNTLVMINAVELLVKTMKTENILYPLHLGVTEAGEGEDGTIKSCIGLGTLLFQGIGDTIRVSLTCEPENEIPIAVKVRDFFDFKNNECIEILENEFLKKNEFLPLVISAKTSKNINNSISDIEIIDFDICNKLEKFNAFVKYNSTIYSIDNKDIKVNNQIYESLRNSQIFHIKFDDLMINDFEESNFNVDSVIIVEFMNRENIFDFYKTKVYQKFNGSKIIFHKKYIEKELIDFQINCSLDVSYGIIKDIFSGLLITNTNFEEIVSENLAFSILQSAQKRLTKTEFISCPSCGRTLFDIQKISKQIKEEIGYENLIKVAVMGCIVNGPGEMADADYGYIGAGNKKVNIYRRQECIATHIPEEEAIAFLKRIIDEDQKK